MGETVWVVYSVDYDDYDSIIATPLAICTSEEKANTMMETHGNPEMGDYVKEEQLDTLIVG